MSLPATVKWVLLALAGLAIAIGVAFAAADLAGRQIGIASESVSAGDALAPSPGVPGERKRGGQGDREAPPPGGTTTAPAKPPATTIEEPPPPAEGVEPPAGGGGDDYGGGGDSDD